MTKIILENVSYRYDHTAILKQINLTVQTGEIVSILGPSGVGKTTLFNLIAGILPVEQGQILVDNVVNPSGKVSYMLQKDLLLEHKTVLGNIILPLIIQGVAKKDAVLRAEELLLTFNLSDIRNRYPHELSGGMRQRVALLRTYMFGQDVFLLDEAFSALDEMTKMELHKWYLSIHKQLNLTTLLITHSIDEAIELSDRIYILNNKPGQIIAELKMNWREEKNPEIAKLTYKKDILTYLELQ
ncbi:ABC transporter ATP-binding protein [Streptococcus suis]|nr:ABC transporter ATP-binding protein [Streptococcus suis]